MGWAPERTTVVDYSDDGRPVAYRTTETPEWDALSHALMVLHAEYLAGCCPSCGRRWDDHKGTTTEDYAAAFFTCPGEAAIERAQHRLAKRPSEKRLRKLGYNPERARFWFAHLRSLLPGGDGKG